MGPKDVGWIHGRVGQFLQGRKFEPERNPSCVLNATAKSIDISLSLFRMYLISRDSNQPETVPKDLPTAQPRRFRNSQQKCPHRRRAKRLRERNTLGRWQNVFSKRKANPKHPVEKRRKARRFPIRGGSGGNVPQMPHQDALRSKGKTGSGKEGLNRPTYLALASPNV